MATEKRLIDANKPINETESIINFRMCHHMPTEDYESFLNYLKKQPTVDAVEVIRCKDCKKWFRHTEVDRERGECRRYQTTKHETGFCDRGERKDNVL